MYRMDWQSRHTHQTVSALFLTPSCFPILLILFATVLRFPLLCRFIPSKSQCFNRIVPAKKRLQPRRNHPVKPLQWFDWV
jgi:hypothetical protein